jgi:hypothetical protein
MAYTTKVMTQNTYLQGTSTVALYTVGTGIRSIVKEMILCNTNNSAVAVTVYYYAYGGTEAKGTILSAVSLAAGETKMLSLSSVLNAGDKITGFAGIADKVSIYISGIEENV